MTKLAWAGLFMIWFGGVILGIVFGIQYAMSVLS